MISIGYQFVLVFAASRIPLPWTYVDRAWWALPASNCIKTAHMPAKWTEVTPLSTSTSTVLSPFLSPNVDICTGPSSIKRQRLLVSERQETTQRSEIHLPLSSTSNWLKRLRWFVLVVLEDALVTPYPSTSYKEN